MDTGQVTRVTYYRLFLMSILLIFLILVVQNLGSSALAAEWCYPKNYKYSLKWLKYKGDSCLINVATQNNNLKYGYAMLETTAKETNYKESTATIWVWKDALEAGYLFRGAPFGNKEEVKKVVILRENVKDMAGNIMMTWSKPYYLYPSLYDNGTEEEPTKRVIEIVNEGNTGITVRR
ncbi:MAG: hypothetical protein F6K21_33860 [Symploca sp. SIO2D2]|nr:hypothetical protein [Symploca sp. SIO2D2]